MRESYGNASGRIYVYDVDSRCGTYTYFWYAIPFSSCRSSGIFGFAACFFYSLVCLSTCLSVTMPSTRTHSFKSQQPGHTPANSQLKKPRETTTGRKVFADAVPTGQTIAQRNLETFILFHFNFFFFVMRSPGCLCVTLCRWRPNGISGHWKAIVGEFKKEEGRRNSTRWIPAGKGNLWAHCSNRRNARRLICAGHVT